MQNISPTMDGTIVAIGVSLIICVVWTLIAPEKDGNYDAYKTIQLEDCEDLPSESEEDPMAMNRALKVPIDPIHKCNACSAKAPACLHCTPACGPDKSSMHGLRIRTTSR